MYRVLCDNEVMCDSRVEELALISPVVKLEENKAGSFVFTIPPTHPKYDAIQKRRSIIDVFQDEVMIFSGVCTEESKDFYNQKKVYCEGELAFFNDSVQRPARYQDITVRGLLEAYINNHNAQVEEAKRFKVGMVTVTDSNDSIYCYTNYNSTMTELKEDLVDDLGGFFRIQHVNGVRYLDYLTESQNTNSQVIQIGNNLMDFSSNIDSSDIATAIIPLGCRLENSSVEGLEARLTISDVNDGKDYVYNADAVNAYGWIYKTVEWDDVTVASRLKTKGEKYLSDIQFENMVIEAKAVDLHLTDKDIEQFKISDQIRVVSKPHGLDRYFRLTKMTINLNNPENTTITLGKDEKLSLSAKTNKVNEEIKKAIDSIVPPSSILKSAMENATQLIKNSMNGYITTIMDENGNPKELLIMDTNSTETATKVWRWNINGLGYSSTGYNGTYELAMTMDGSIVADRITTGTMFADRIKCGTLKLGGYDHKNGVIEVYDSQAKDTLGYNLNKCADDSAIKNTEPLEVTGSVSLLKSLADLRGIPSDLIKNNKYMIISFYAAADEVSEDINIMPTMTYRHKNGTLYIQSGLGSGQNLTADGTFYRYTSVYKMGDSFKENCDYLSTVSFYHSYSWKDHPVTITGFAAKQVMLELNNTGAVSNYTASFTGDGTHSYEELFTSDNLLAKIDENGLYAIDAQIQGNLEVGGISNEVGKIEVYGVSPVDVSGMNLNKPKNTDTSTLSYTIGDKTDGGVWVGPSTMSHFEEIPHDLLKSRAYMVLSVYLKCDSITDGTKTEVRFVTDEVEGGRWSWGNNDNFHDVIADGEWHRYSNVYEMTDYRKYVAVSNYSYSITFNQKATFTGMQIKNPMIEFNDTGEVGDYVNPIITVDNGKSYDDLFTAGGVITTIDKDGIHSSKGVFEGDIIGANVTGAKIQTASRGKRAVIDSSSSFKGMEDDNLHNLINMENSSKHMIFDASTQLDIRANNLAVRKASYGDGDGEVYNTITGDMDVVTNVKKNMNGCKEQWVGEVYCTLPVFLDVTYTGLKYELGFLRNDTTTTSSTI